MIETKEQQIDRDFDLLAGLLMPWGSLDFKHLIIKANELDVDMYTLRDILEEQAENFCIDLYNYNTDINALFNDYILSQANNDICDKLEIDLYDCDVYFFANYLDDPLQYTNECQEDIQNKIDSLRLTRNDFNKYSLYVFDTMGIELEE